MSFISILIVTCIIIGSVYMQKTSPDQAKLNAIFADANTQANSINILSVPLSLIGQGPFPKLIVDITQIIDLLNVNAANSDTVSGYNLDPILCDLTTILIGKAGILSDLPVISPPMEQVLKALEAAVDNDLNAQNQSESQAGFDDCLGRAITAYTPVV